MKRNVKRPYTGGELNTLNEVAGISAASKTVPVMKLINYHKPKSEQELVKLIDEHRPEHRSEPCPCGCKSTGTITEFGDQLYEAQNEFWDKYRYSKTECRNWMYDLFITMSLRGDSMEQKAQNILQEHLPGFEVQRADTTTDTGCSVDLEIFRGNILILGVQVKPSSYIFCKTGTKERNIFLNSKYPVPVYYVYYNHDGVLGVQQILENIYSRWS